jgi:hypothetical protein
MRFSFIILLLALSVSVCYSATAITTLGGVARAAAAINTFCGDLKGLLPVAAMLMVVAAGVTYAAGQLMGAETRARANVWATAMLVGAIVGLLIYAIAPTVLNTVYGGSGVSC